MGFGSEGPFQLEPEIENGTDTVCSGGVTVLAQKLLLCSIPHTHLGKVQLGRYSCKKLFIKLFKQKDDKSLFFT